jgi:LuxR family maltose regulon positive regulatory protein
MLGLRHWSRADCRRLSKHSNLRLRVPRQVIGRESAAAALPAGYLAALYYESNELSRAQRVVSGRTAISMHRCPLGSLLRYCRGAARVYARDGDLEFWRL